MHGGSDERPEALRIPVALARELELLKKLFPAPNIMRRKEDVFADAFAAWCRGG